MQHIAILGDGSWGTTLAIYLTKQGYRVRLWGAFPEYVAKINKTRLNSQFLPGIKIPGSVIISDNLADVVVEAGLVVLAIPSHYARPIIKKLKKFDFSKKILLSVVKGVETSSLLRISEVIRRELGNIPFATLSGPTIATEVARGIPSTAVIASKNRRVAKQLQEVFNSRFFRMYTNTDITGVEIGGSVKNIIAIACGLCDGLGFGANTKAALLTRGLAEMARLGTRLGAKTKTFSGLSGLGDLVTTCFSEKSRNRFVGEQLGKGKTIHAITSGTAMVAEGVTTVKAIYRLSKKYKVSMPITTEVYRIIYQKKEPLKAVADLMGRSLKNE